MMWSKRKDVTKLDDTHDRVIRLEERHSRLGDDVQDIKTDTKDIKKIVTDLQIAQAAKKG